MKINHIYQPNMFLTIHCDGVSYTVRKDNDGAVFDRAVEALMSEDFDTLISIMSPAKHIAQLVAQHENIEVRDNAVYYDGVQVHNVVVQRILEFREHGSLMMPLVRFLRKLMMNPSKRAVDELYKFLEHKQMPITENGNFIAYKGVDNNYYSIHAGDVVLLKGTANDRGQIYNGVGEEIQIPRNQVDDNKENHCSYGLHAGSLDYANSFRGSGKLMVVEIDPSDVVSIPSDYDCKKLRTCRYKVVSEYTAPITAPLVNSEFRTENDDILDEDFSDHCDDDSDFQYEIGDQHEYELDCFGDPMEHRTLYVIDDEDGNKSIAYYDCNEELFYCVESGEAIAGSDSEPMPLHEDERVDSDGDAINTSGYIVGNGALYSWDKEQDCFIRDGVKISYLEAHIRGIKPMMAKRR